MLLTVVALFFSAIAAGMIQSVIGFGAAVLLMLILSLFFSMAVSAGVSSSICLGLTGIMAWRYRKHIQWKLILLPAICYLMTSTIAIKYSKGINIPARFPHCSAASCYCLAVIPFFSLSGFLFAPTFSPPQYVAWWAASALVCSVQVDLSLPCIIYRPAKKRKTIWPIFNFSFCCPTL